jgi:hypothetical protein
MPDVIRRLRGFEVHDFLDASEQLATIDDDHRSLQTGCTPSRDWWRSSLTRLSVPVLEVVAD